MSNRLTILLLCSMVVMNATAQDGTIDWRDVNSDSSKNNSSFATCSGSKLQCLKERLGDAANADKMIKKDDVMDLMCMARWDHTWKEVQDLIKNRKPWDKPVDQRFKLIGGYWESVLVMEDMIKMIFKDDQEVKYKQVAWLASDYMFFTAFKTASGMRGYRIKDDDWSKCEQSSIQSEVASGQMESQNSWGESDIMDAIMDTPISICVDAEPWQFYFGGVIDASTCDQQLDHCVHLVAYQEESNYWVVKNSWNTNWGEDGYIRVNQGSNTCGVAEEATTIDASDED